MSDSNVLGDTIIDGVYASEATDKSAERLKIANCDLSSLHAGEGVLIWEHKKDTESTALDVVGTIIYAKKIFGTLDCEDERQRYFYDLVRMPMIYGRARLYDGAQHPGAQAVAAMIRDHYANKEFIVARYSIDGSTLEKQGQELTHTICRAVAVTIRPCNQTCDSGLVSDAMLESMGLMPRKGALPATPMTLQCSEGQGILVPPPINKKESLMLAVVRGAMAQVRRDLL